MQGKMGAYEASTLSLSGDTDRTLSPQDVPYLLVIEDDRSSVFPLPAKPEIVIGRSLDADLPLRQTSVSRHHARLLYQGDLLQICDLGSHNGVLVNGERITDKRAVFPGDVIGVGDALLIVQQRPMPNPCVVVMDAAAVRQRLREECDRAVRNQQRVTLLHVEFGVAETDSTYVLNQLKSHLRPFDAVATLNKGQLAIIVASLSTEDISELVSALLTSLPATARIGHSSCPTDGIDADTLLLIARQAARCAGVLRHGGPESIPQRRLIGKHDVIIADPAMLRTYELLERLAPSQLPVLIHGETGSGKEIAAAVLHHGSPRSAQRLLALNCAALPEALAESELFGHERGAFSGANSQKVGLLESAPGGTLFLDELADLSLGVQAKLLRALETRRVMRVGDTQERPINIRLVAATHRNIETEVKAGRFRQDLYFRLSAAVIVLPPLRHRPIEIPLLARLFLRQARQRLGRTPLEITDEVMACLMAYAWPGNVRELQNDMEYLAAVVPDEIVEYWHLPAKLGGPQTATFVTKIDAGAHCDRSHAFPGFLRPLEEEVRELERKRITEALTRVGGVQTRAAELLGMPRRTFFAKIKQYGISARSLKDAQSVPG